MPQSLLTRLEGTRDSSSQYRENRWDRQRNSPLADDDSNRRWKIRAMHQPWPADISSTNPAFRRFPPDAALCLLLPFSRLQALTVLRCPQRWDQQAAPNSPVEG